MPQTMEQKKTELSKVPAVLFVMLLSALTSGWMLTTEPLGDHESFVAVTAREMIQNDDYIVPVCNGQIRLQKTPLNYWLVIGTAKFTKTVDELAARLPSMLLAMLSTAAILYFVTVILDFQIAAFAALVWSTSLGFVRYGHNARPEISLTCFTAIAMLAFCAALTSLQRRRQIIYMLIFWISFALAMLAKGPAPLPLIAIPLFLFVVITKQWKFIIKALPIAGPIIFLAIILPWPILLASRLIQSSEAAQSMNVVDFWQREFVSRFMGEYAAGSKPFYFYGYVMFRLMLPWMAFVPIALISPFYKIWGKKQRLMLFFWLWCVGNIIFMSISGGKRNHYILPAMPAIAVLIGISLQDMFFEQKAYTKDFIRNLFLGHLGAIGVVLIAVPVYMAKKQPELFQTAIIFSAITLITIVAFLTLILKKKSTYACVVFFTGLAILMSYTFGELSIAKNSMSHLKRFAREVDEYIPADDRIYAYKEIPMRFVFYFQRPVPVIEDMKELHQQYLRDCWIVALEESLDKLIADGRFHTVQTWEKAAQSHRKIVPGVLFHKPDSPDEANQ
jgi:4-amino-4-deoxy-L-arabinose transferase-like glycosyltransferase